MLPPSDLQLYHSETLEMMLQRWSKLERDFRMKSGRYDISKIPDIYDCVKYDVQHNSSLGLDDTLELFRLSRALANIVIPQVRKEMLIFLQLCWLAVAINFFWGKTFSLHFFSHITQSLDTTKKWNLKMYSINLMKPFIEYSAGIIIRHFDILILFFFKYNLPIPNHINLNNYD